MEELLKTLEIQVTACTKLSRGNEELVEHYLLESDGQQYFLKLHRPPTNAFKSAIRPLLGHPSMQRQVDVHAALQRLAFPNLRVPRLIDADPERYLLMEFVAKEDAIQAESDALVLVSMLIEFQLADAAPRARGWGSLLLDVVLDPMIAVSRTTATRLRRLLGVRVALRCIRALWKCRRTQPRLPRTVLIHNDFHPENVLHGKNGSLYMTDFENVTTSFRWVLVDIVHYAVGTHEVCIDTELIRRYIRTLQDSLVEYHLVHLDAQVRLALIRRVIQHVTTSAPPKHVRAEYARFLTDTLLPDRAFQDWYASHIF